MRIEIDSLENGKGTFAHTYETGEIVLDEEHARLTREPEIKGRVSRKAQEVSVAGHISAQAEVDCGRCLKSVSVPVETDFEVTYVPASDYAQEEDAAELHEEDLAQAVFDGGTIDIDELVREQVLLAMPTRALCVEDCKGLCPVCGADRNAEDCACQTSEIDPRWAALGKLVNGK
ncbi:MAG: DUF177 domain-containing protein [Pyrinomonadaceae bacterium]